MKLRHLKGALDPILVEGTEDLYIRADFVWDDVDLDFDTADATRFSTKFLVKLAQGKVLLHGEKQEAVEPAAIAGEPPLIIGKLAAAVMTTLAMYGMGRPPDPKPKPKARSRATRS